MEFFRPELWGTGFYTLVQEDGVARFALEPPNSYLYFSLAPPLYYITSSSLGSLFHHSTIIAWPGCCHQQVLMSEWGNVKPFIEQSF